MASFIHDHFLLHGKTSQKLYHQYASELPIIDFHNHLDAQSIANNQQFDNIGQVWLGGDHYKWRAMRINGVEEEFCSGQASDKKKFLKWAETLPYTVGNPLHHWTQLELTRYFGITELLTPDNAQDIYDQTSERLRSPEFSTRNLLKKMKVEMVGTTDDPIDTLEHHQQLFGNKDLKVLPTFRADRVIQIENLQAWNTYIDQLAQVADVDIHNFDNLVEALDIRHAFFHSLGGRLSDSGPEFFYFADYNDEQIATIFHKLRNEENITLPEAEQYKTAIMVELSKLNHKRGWTQQFHVGALRNNNSRKFQELGADTGWDSIGNALDSKKLSRFLDRLDQSNQLARTILYNLNPADNEMMLTMCGNFCDGSAVAKVQYGAAWWFLDQKSGMEKHLRDLSALGLLSRFVGMVTDSRSFLSFPRHEYFRRIACNYIGQEVDQGLIPNDPELLKMLVENISYKNAKNYFNF
jgi:glucuronate isomerase